MTAESTNIVYNPILLFFFFSFAPQFFFSTLNTIIKAD